MNDEMRPEDKLLEHVYGDRGAQMLRRWFTADEIDAMGRAAGGTGRGQTRHLLERALTEAYLRSESQLCIASEARVRALPRAEPA